MKYTIKSKQFYIGKLRLKNINNKYINALNRSDQISFKKINILNQKKYIRNLRAKKIKLTRYNIRNNEILEIFYINKIIATSGFQINIKKKTAFQGILIIDDKFKGGGFSKFFISACIIEILKFYKLNFVIAGVSNNNIISKKTFLGAGFKYFKRIKSNNTSYFKIDLKKDIKKLTKILKI
jgi:hypothetical protein